MDPQFFDAATRLLSPAPSRRLVVRGLTGAMLSLAGVSPPRATTAKKRKRLKFNAFGCVNVGGKCRGKDANCCSGVCERKQSKNGKRAASRCVAHDSRGCRTGQTTTACFGADTPCTTSAGNPGKCYTTTGNAGYCAVEGGGDCFVCKQDADCQLFCGQAAACTRCAGCPSTGGTGCVGTGNCDFSP